MGKGDSGITKLLNHHNKHSFFTYGINRLTTVLIDLLHFAHHGRDFIFAWLEHSAAAPEAVVVCVLSISQFAIGDFVTRVFQGAGASSCSITVKH